MKFSVTARPLLSNAAATQVLSYCLRRMAIEMPPSFQVGLAVRKISRSVAAIGVDVLTSDPGERNPS
jgi:hypothetical protein